MVNPMNEIITFFVEQKDDSEAGLSHGKYGSSLVLLPGRQQLGMPGMFTSPLFVTSITPQLLLLLPSRSPPSKTVLKSEGWMLENSLFPADEGRWGKWVWLAAVAVAWDRGAGSS